MEPTATTTTTPVTTTEPPVTTTTTTPAVTTPPVTTTTPTTTTPPATAPIDTAEIEKKITETVTGTVSKSVIEKIGEALGLTKKEEEKLPTDPEGLRKFIAEESKKQAEAIIKSKEDAITTTETQREEQLKQGAEGYKKVWSREYDSISESGLAPKIEKADDPQDPGNIIKTKILVKLKEVLDENAKNGQDYVPSLWEITHKYPEVLKADVTVPGATVPISGGGKGGQNGDNFYNRVHSTSIEDMVANKG